MLVGRFCIAQLTVGNSIIVHYKRRWVDSVFTVVVNSDNDIHGIVLLCGKGYL